MSTVVKPSGIDHATGLYSTVPATDDVTEGTEIDGLSKSAQTGIENEKETYLAPAGIVICSATNAEPTTLYAESDLLSAMSEFVA